ncbi:MAG: nucleotidyltransferase domain-containing protein [Candidatus Woesearchaeota archaeon]
MEFKIQRKRSINIDKYKKDELDIAYEFSKKVYNEFKGFIKAIVLFGSLSRKLQGVGKENQNEKSDIDIMVIVDDLTIELTPEVVETYRIIMERLIVETSQRLHVTSLKFTHFWDYVRAGDPIAINILSDGVAILDTGFFEPLQALLFQGRIRPSEEAIWAYYARAPRTIELSKNRLLQATLDLYWAVIDSAHAALMREGAVPPTPKHVAEMMDEVLVKNKLLEKKYVEIMKKFYELSKKIIYRDLKSISGKEFDTYYKEAKDFVERMHKIVNSKRR